MRKIVPASRAKAVAKWLSCVFFVIGVSMFVNDASIRDVTAPDAGIDVVDTLLYRGKASHIDTVMIQGEVVVRNGTFIKMDKADVLREIKEQFARPVEEKALEAKKLAQGLTPFVQEFYKDWGKAETTPHYGYNSRV